MGIFYVIFHRMPALCCAVLSSASLALSIGAFKTCQFLKIAHSAHSPEDGFLVSDGEQIEESEDYVYDRHNVGIFCPSTTYSAQNDLLWNLSRYFLISAFVLLGCSVILSWGVATFVKPTHKNWKALSVISIMTAGLQIPAFLFYAIKPCQTGERQCKAGQGFFMLLWSVMLLTFLTIITQCFNYPAWREIEESWKVQERDHPLYDENEDTFDTVDLDGVESPQRYEKRRLRGDDRDVEYGNIGIITSYPTQELNVHRRKKKLKKKNEDGNFYQLQDDADIVSQCLSGMSAELPLGLDPDDFDMEEDEELEEEDSKLIFAETDVEASDELKPPSVTHNENWGENIRKRALSEGTPERKKAPLLQSPKRWPFTNKGNENIGYIFLTEDDDDQVSQLVFGDDAEPGVYNVDTIRIPSSTIRNTAVSEGADAVVTDSIVGENDEKYSENVQQRDEGGQDAIVNLSVSANDVDKDDNESEFHDCDTYSYHSSSNSEPMVHSDTIIINTESAAIERYAHVHVVSDDDEDCNAVRDKKDIVPTDRFLSRVHALSKFTNIKYPQLTEDAHSEQSNEWHDVLDGLNSYPMARRDSDDLDDGHDPLLLIKRSNANNSKDSMNLAPIERTPQNNTPGIDDVVNHVVVSDDEDDLESPGRTLYPDEVEV